MKYLADRIADQRVDLAEHAVGLFDQVLQIVLGRNVCRNRQRDLLAGFIVDSFRDLVASLLLARGDHDARAMFGHSFGNRTADAAR